jgi:hypothetical protein
LFSSEIRQEPLTSNRLGILCKLVELQQEREEYSESVANLSGSAKRPLEDRKKPESRRLTDTIRIALCIK